MTHTNGHYHDDLFDDVHLPELTDKHLLELTDMHLPDELAPPKAEQEPKIRTKVRRVPAATTEAIRIAMELSKAEFSHALGYATSSGYASATIDDMVSVKTELAAQGLYAAHLERVANKPHFSLTIVEDGIAHTISGTPAFRYNNGVRHLVVALRNSTPKVEPPKQITHEKPKAVASDPANGRMT